MSTNQQRPEPFSCVGHSVPRIDALDKVLGRAVYAEDISFPNMLYGRVLRAGVPHAIIEEIDTRQARAMKGVVCILTAKNVPGLNRYGIAFQDQYALAEDKVRYIGDPVALVAADIAKIDRIFAISGAQAIAAMAYGTESVPKVDKICGPGNLFVMLAKRQVYGAVGIDGLQGPSEVVIIADAEANPAWVAREILAQAEHDSLAQVLLITTSEALAEAVQKEIGGEMPLQERRGIIEESLPSGSTKANPRTVTPEACAAMLQSLI